MTETILPKAIEDIGWWTLFKKKDKLYYSLGSKSLDVYLSVDEDTLPIIIEIIGFMDGKHSLEWIEKYFLENKNTQIDINHLYVKLADAGCICNIPPKQKNSEIAIMGVDILSKKFKLLPERYYNPIKIIWNIVFVLSLVILVIAIIEVIFKWDKFIFVVQQSFVYDNSYVLGGALVGLASIIGLVIHELAHWFTAVRFGLQPSEFHLTLYTGILPTWYFKINGMYTLPVKKRVAVSASGMIANALIIFIVIIIALEANLGLLQVQILSKIIYSFFINIIFSLMPISLTDGYFILSWLFGISNLRIKMLSTLKLFINGTIKKFDKVVLVYCILCISLLIVSIYNGVYWNVKIIKEICSRVGSYYIKCMIFCVPLLFYIITLYRFIKKFTRFIKSV